MYNNFSKYDVYTDFGSLYCYKNSLVLRNKYAIHDSQALRKLEQDIVGAKQYYLLDNPIRGKFTSNHLCLIHRFLFEDVYSFAGRFRLETIKKGETTFENEKVISEKLHRLLAMLKQENYLAHLPDENFIERLSYYFAELNYIHPFREGNGRAIREFIRLLATRNEYIINWAAVDVNTLMNSMVESVYDTTPLSDVLRVCVIKATK